MFKMRKLSPRHKKGVSEMVGHVLLIVIALGVSILVYSYLKLYVPGAVPECPDGVSLVIQEASCPDVNSQMLQLKLLNKGRFTIDKAFIRIGDPGRKVKTIVNKDSAGNIASLSENGLDPGESITYSFGVDKDLTNVNGEVEVQPIIKDEKTGKDAACNALNARIFVCGQVSQTIQPNSPPSVSITSPANGAQFFAPATITITASASDPDSGDSISKVEFFQGGAPLGTDTDGTDGWSFTWSNVPVGTYTLTAKAYDSRTPSASATSSPISVSVTSLPSRTIVPLQVFNSPSNAGSITSTENRINCGSDCFEYYDKNTQVTLTATPTANSGYLFNYWLGYGTECHFQSGNTCTLTMDTGKTVTAVYDTGYTLTVDFIAQLQSSSGSVLSVGSNSLKDGKISCVLTNGVKSGDCSENYPKSSPVQLQLVAQGSTEVVAGKIEPTSSDPASAERCTIDSSHKSGNCAVFMTTVKKVTITFR